MENILLLSPGLGQGKLTTGTLRCENRKIRQEKKEIDKANCIEWYQKHMCKSRETIPF
jgi:hypothetical protein